MSSLRYDSGVEEEDLDNPHAGQRGAGGMGGIPPEMMHMFMRVRCLLYFCFNMKNERPLTILNQSLFLATYGSRWRRPDACAFWMSLYRYVAAGMGTPPECSSRPRSDLFNFLKG